MTSTILKAGLSLVAATMSVPAMASDDVQRQAGGENGRVDSRQEPNFVHHVYFWLKNPGSSADRGELVEGLKALSDAPMIRRFQIGLPANTSRDVVDNSYDVSWLLMFDDAVDQDAYQVDPLHLGFVKRYAHLWDRVVVYDSVAVD